MVGGALATVGELVFTGESDGWFRAYDAKTGKALWSFFTGAGGSRVIGSKRGNDIIAFTF